MPTTSTPRQGGQLIKFNTLLANLVVFHNALDISDIVRQLVQVVTATLGRQGHVHPHEKGRRRPRRRGVGVPEHAVL